MSDELIDEFEEEDDDEQRRPVNFTGGVEIDGRTRFGVDAESSAQLEAKRDKRFEQHLLAVVSAITGAPMRSDADFAQTFVDGSALVLLANAIVPDSCPPVTGKGSTLKSMANVAAYLKAANQHFKLRPEELVAPTDVTHARNPVALARHLSAVVRFAKTLPRFAHIEFHGPQIRAELPKSWSFRDAELARQAAFDEAKKNGFREPVPIWSRPRDLLLVLLQLMVLVRVATMLSVRVCAPVEFRALPPSAPPPSCDLLRSSELLARVELILAPEHHASARAQHIALLCETIIEASLAVVALAGIVALLAGFERWRRPALVHAVYYVAAVLPKLVLVEGAHVLVDGIAWTGDEVARLGFLTLFCTLWAMQVRRFARDQHPFTARMAKYLKRFKSH